MLNSGIKIRSFPKENYRGIYFKGITIRQIYDTSKPISDLEYPEFYDVKITGKCNGQCPWCYQDSKPENNHYIDAIEKINKFFGVMTENQKPFQVAIGGGEPTLHPHFVDILRTFYELGITPNYTTNGMNITQEIIDATHTYCGGVAISCHKHLEKYWKNAINKFRLDEIKLNLHIIISDIQSINDFLDIYHEYEKDVDYFVLLPHTKKGRAKEKKLEHEYLFDKVEELNTNKIAFGALFHPFLLNNKKRFDLSLYEPEIMSKYLDLKDMKLYKSSFSEDVIKNLTGEI